MATHVRCGTLVHRHGGRRAQDADAGGRRRPPALCRSDGGRAAGGQRRCRARLRRILRHARACRTCIRTSRTAMRRPRRTSISTSRWNSARSAACSSRRRCLAAGYTSICSPGDAGQISLSVRNAIDCGLFDGPRVTAAGRYLTSRQGLTDWYPTLDRRARYLDRPAGDEPRRGDRGDPRAGEERRRLHQDRARRRADGVPTASSSPPSTRKRRAQWWPRRIASAARWWCMRAAARPRSMPRAPASTSSSTPTTSTTNASTRCWKVGQRHRPDAHLPAQHRRLHPAARARCHQGRIGDVQREYETACANLRKAREAGIPMMTGTDSGFAVTPYGEWHAREIEIFVKRSRLHAGRGAARGDAVTARLHGRGRARSACSSRAAPPTSSRSPARRSTNVSLLQDKARIRHVHIAASAWRARARLRSLEGHRPGMDNWNDLYTQERVAELGIRPARQSAALQDS